MVRFGLLGPLVIVDADGHRLDPGGPRPRLMLAMLLAASGRIVSTDSIVDELWGDDPPTSVAGTIQTYVSRLRRLVDPERDRGGKATSLVFESPGYLLRLDEADLDTARFERLADEGRTHLTAGRHEAARAVLSEALSLWRGPALAEYHDRDWARGIAVRLEDRRLTALDDRIAADLALGRHAVVVGELSALVDAHPFREGFVAQLATALCRADRQADALRTIDHARRTLRDELGLEMSPRLQALEHAILDHDEALFAWPGGTRLAQPSPPTDAPSDAPTDAPESSSSATSPVEGRSGDRLVGRVAEMRLLRSVLDEARTATRVVIVEGEPGIGKTRLAHEIAGEATARNAVALWGRSLEGEAAPALWPWLPLLRTLAAAEPKGSELGPELATLLAPTGAGPTSPDMADAVRFPLVESIAALLAEHARRRPIVLVLDDIQWADKASLDLLAAIPARLSDAPLLIVATMRDLEIGRRDALVDTLATLTRLPGTTRIALRGLDASETAELVERASGSCNDAATIAEIHRRAEGNPFFTTELARLLATGVDRADVPAGVRDVVRRRLSLLPSSSVELLQVAAILGRDVDIDQLVVATGNSIDVCLDDLDPPLVHRLLIADAHRPQTYRFAHGLVREVMLSDISPLKTARLHLRVADAVDDTDDNAEIIAEHLWRAAPVGVTLRAADALERAGRVALWRFAYTSAEDLFARAVELRRAPARGSADPDGELRLLMQHVSVLVALRGYPAVLGHRSHLRAKALATELERESDLACLLWAERAAEELACHHRRADAIAEDMLRRVSPDGPPEQRAMAHAAYGIRLWHHGDISRAVRHTELAFAAASEVPVPSMVAARVDGGGAAVDRNDDPTRWALFDREQFRVGMAYHVYLQDLTGSVDDPEAAYRGIIDAISGDHYWELIAQSFAASSALTVGDLDRALRATRRGLVIDPENVTGLWGVSLRCFHGAAVALSGDVDEGLDVLDRAWATLTARGMQMNGVTFMSSRAHALAAAGRIEEATAALDDARRQLASTEEQFALPTLILAEAVHAHASGDAAGADERFRTATALATDQGSHAVARHVERTAASLGHPIASPAA